MRIFHGRPVLSSEFGIATLLLLDELFRWLLAFSIFIVVLVVIIAERVVLVIPLELALKHRSVRISLSRLTKGCRRSSI